MDDFINTGFYSFKPSQNNNDEGFSRDKAEYGKMINPDVIAKEPSHNKINNLAIAKLHEALAKLNIKQKQAVDLIVFQGLSFKKAAKIAGVSKNAMVERFQLALRNLRTDEGLATCTDMIKGEGGHDEQA